MERGLGSRKFGGLGVLLSGALIFSGCGTVGRNYVITGSSTVFGLQMGRSLENQMYDIKFGYSRTELALVPTNGPPVLMELYFSGRKNFYHNGFYQRLAVGQSSVGTAGAALLFSKDVSGVLDPGVAQKIYEKILDIPEVR